MPQFPSLSSMVWRWWLIFRVLFIFMMKNSVWDRCLSISWITKACPSVVVLSCCWTSMTVMQCLYKYLNFSRLRKFKMIFPLWGSICYKIVSALFFLVYAEDDGIWLLQATLAQWLGLGLFLSGPFLTGDLKWWLLHANGNKYLSQKAARERTLGMNCWPRDRSQNKGSATVLTNASLYFKKSLVGIPLLNNPGRLLMWNRTLAAFQPVLVLLLPLLIHPGASHLCLNEEMGSRMVV